jgi:hypothetical protein
MVDLLLVLQLELLFVGKCGIELVQARLDTPDYSEQTAWQFDRNSVLDQVAMARLGEPRVGLVLLALRDAGEDLLDHLNGVAIVQRERRTK